MTATPRAVELVETAALAAADKLADGIIAYDVSDQLVITDAFLLCSAPNDRQVKAIVDEIELRMRQAGASLVRREGELVRGCRIPAHRMYRHWRVLSRVDRAYTETTPQR